MRPMSIVNFERCYLGAVLIGFINSILNFSARNTNPQLAQATAMFGTGFFIIFALLGLAIPLLLWYFTARRASVVAKWIITVFFAIGALFFLFSLGRIFHSGLIGILSIIGFVLQAVAVYLLFKPDANAWFARGGVDLAEPFA